MDIPHRPNRPGPAPAPPKKVILIVTEEGLAAIAGAVRYAFEHPMDQRELYRLLGQQSAGLKITPPQQQQVNLPVHWSMIFTVEIQEAGWTRHLSIALKPRFYGPDSCPDETAVELLLKLFEFEQPTIKALNHIKVATVSCGQMDCKTLQLYQDIKVFPPYANR